MGALPKWFATMQRRPRMKLRCRKRVERTMAPMVEAWRFAACAPPSPPRFRLIRLEVGK